MELTTQPASAYSLAELAELFNRGFAGYFMPVQFTEENFAIFVARDGIDLDASRVLLSDGQRSGLGMIARRGPHSRLAAMGIAEILRGQGAGSWLMRRLLKEAHSRGETRMGLEVITKNEPAIKLYEKNGFTRLRQLLGFSLKNPRGEAGELEICQLATVVHLVQAQGLPNLPWQVDDVTLARMDATTFCYQLGSAYAAISDPEAEHVAFRSLIVESAQRQQGQAMKLLKALFARFPGKTWHVSPIFPEEMAVVFEKAGFKPEALSQWQMTCEL